MPRDKATMESFSPERSVEEPGGLGALGRLTCPQKRKSGGSQTLPPRNPHTPLFIFSTVSSISTLRDPSYPLNSNACLHLAVLLEENKKSKQNFEDQRFFSFFKKYACSKDRPFVHSEGTPGHPSEGCVARAGLLPRATRWPSTKVRWLVYSACGQFLQEPRRGSPSSSDSS